MSRKIPEGSIAGRTTPEFTAETVPNALLHNHHTTVWAELIVEQGSVRFVQDEPPYNAIATASSPVVIPPNVKHRVEPTPGCRFRVQFWESGP